MGIPHPSLMLGGARTHKNTEMDVSGVGKTENKMLINQSNGDPHFLLTKCQ